ncbi:hypothetical protein KC799_12490 [candidate division KSB1 bacterium]|nr:hypothetical protein [candidate division KSB1 bacterium]
MSLKSPEQKKLEQDNFLLKSKIIARGGELKEFPKLSPKIENKFLQNVIDFEDAPTKPVWAIVGIDPDDYPPSAGLSHEEMLQKLNDLVFVFAQNGFIYDLADDLPPKLAYEYFIDQFLYSETKQLPEGWRTHIDGCDGDCNECFQLPYCKHKDQFNEDGLLR